MRACWLKWVGRDWSISADYIWLNYSDANSCGEIRTTWAIKAEKQSVFHRNLGGAWGGIDSRHPVHLRKWLWSQKESEPFFYLMERATGSPRVCFANPCFAAGHWPLRAALENAHAFSQLRTLPGSIPVARHVYENGSGTK